MQIDSCQIANIYNYQVYACLLPTKEVVLLGQIETISEDREHNVYTTVLNNGIVIRSQYFPINGFGPIELVHNNSFLHNYNIAYLYLIDSFGYTPYFTDRLYVQKYKFLQEDELFMQLLSSRDFKRLQNEFEVVSMVLYYNLKNVYFNTITLGFKWREGVASYSDINGWQIVQLYDYPKVINILPLPIHDLTDAKKTDSWPIVKANIVFRRWVEDRNGVARPKDVQLTVQGILKP